MNPIIITYGEKYYEGLSEPIAHDTVEEDVKMLMRKLQPFEQELSGTGGTVTIGMNRVNYPGASITTVSIPYSLTIRIVEAIRS